MNFDWLNNLPVQLVQFLEQLMPLPLIVRKYKNQVRMLELEVLTLTNILLAKKIITLEQLEEIKLKTMETKKKEYEEQDMIEINISRDMKKQEIKIPNAGDIKELVDLRANWNSGLERESEIRRKSARMPPKGHQM